MSACVNERLLGWVDAAVCGVGGWGYLLSEEELNVTQQVSAISNVEGSIFMKASADQLIAPQLNTGKFRNQIHRVSGVIF